MVDRAGDLAAANDDWWSCATADRDTDFESYTFANGDFVKADDFWSYATAVAPVTMHTTTHCDHMKMINRSITSRRVEKNCGRTALFVVMFCGVCCLQLFADDTNYLCTWNVHHFPTNYAIIYHGNILKSDTIYYYHITSFRVPDSCRRRSS